MTAEKPLAPVGVASGNPSGVTDGPEGDVALPADTDSAGLAAALRAFAECWPDPDESLTGLNDAADLLVWLDAQRRSQATRIAELTEALRELVACKELHDRIAPLEDRSLDGISSAEWLELGNLQADYRRRKSLAWEVARRALSAGQGEAK